MAQIPHDAFAIIIGAMKCGTTSLYAWLAQHPRICPCISKEPEFFSERQRHGVQVERYEDLWEFDPARHRYALEASTGYSKCPSEPNVAARMRSYGIRPKLIYLVRNPFDRIESHYNYVMHNARRPRQKSFADELNHLVNLSNYSLQLEQYRRHFDRGSLLILDFGELAADPAATLRKVYAFLEMDDAHFPASYSAENRTERLTGAELFLRRSRLRPLVTRLPGPVLQTARKVMMQISAIDRHILTESERTLVFERLKDPMKRFQDEYAIDVGGWGFPRP